MNVFSKVTLEGLKKNKTRTIVTIIGVILSVALLTGITTFISSFQNYLVESTKKLDGNWHVEFNNINSKVLSDIQNDKRVENYSLGREVGFAPLEGSKNKQKPYLFVNEFSKELYNNLYIELISGKLPANENELIISEEVSSNGKVNYNIGDEITLDIGQRTFEDGLVSMSSMYIEGEKFASLEDKRNFKIVGFFKKPNFISYNIPGYMAITELNKSNLKDIDNFNVYVNLKKVSEVYSFTEEISNKNKIQDNNLNEYTIGYKYNNKMLRAHGISKNDMFNTILFGLATILILIIMIGSVLLIHNSFSISVSERTKQFGILSSVGATKGQLLRSVIFEGAFIGVIGIPLGIILGIGGIGVTLKFIGHIISKMSPAEIPITLHVSLISVIIATLIGIVTILISAYIPARKASKLSAIDAIRQTSDIKIIGKKVKTSKLTEKLFKLEGILALKNFKRNRKRYRSTVISLFVSIVLFISSSSFGMYLKQGVDRTIEFHDYDIMYYTRMTPDKDDTMDLYSKMSSVNGITRSLWETRCTLRTQISKELLTNEFIDFMRSEGVNSGDTYSIALNFVDDVTFSKYIRENDLNLEEFTKKNSPKFIAITKFNAFNPKTKRYVSFDVFKNNNPIELSLMNGKEEVKNITITNFLSTFPKGDLSGGKNNSDKVINIIIPYSLMDYMTSGKSINFNSVAMTFSSDDIEKSVEEMTNILKSTVYESNSLANVKEMQKSNENILLMVNIFTYGFVILISLITIANVFNTISTNINLRRREFAMLKSVGMTNKSFNKMMNFECLFYGVKSLLIGLPVSMVITYFIYKVMMIGIDMSYTMPWKSVGISILSVFLVVFITMIYSVNKVKKENIIDELRSDVL